MIALSIIGANSGTDLELITAPQPHAQLRSITGAANVVVPQQSIGGGQQRGAGGGQAGAHRAGDT